MLKEKVKPGSSNGENINKLDISDKEKLRVSDVMDKLDILESEVSHIFVNGRYSGIGKEVQEGDRVGLFPKNMGIIFAEIPKIGSISIMVKLFANLRTYGPPKSIVDIPEGSTIKSLIKKFRISEKEGKLIILINGLPCHDNDYILLEHDQVAIFPPLAGG